MLKELRIENLGIIEQETVRFGPGLNTITGETGAGKSLVLQAMEALSGARLGGGIVRAGSARSIIEGVFELREGETGISVEGRRWEAVDGRFVVRREIAKDGKGRVLVNGQVSNLQVLRLLAAALLEIHGQHEAQRLLDPESHIESLDIFAGTTGERDEVTALYHKARGLRSRLRSMSMDAEERERRISFLEFSVEELEQFEPRAGEYDALVQERAWMQNGERLHGDLSMAYSAIRSEDQSVIDRLYVAEGMIEPHNGILPSVDSLLEELREAMCRLENMGDLLRVELDRLQFSPERLEDVDERLEGYRRLFRKYGNGAETLVRALDSMREELSAIQNGSEEAERLEQELTEADKTLHRAAEALSVSRRAAAAILENLVTLQFADLGMTGAALQISLRREVEAVSNPEEAEKYRVTDKGVDIVEFFLAPNAGEGFKPLRKVASGGEMSRVMLALKTVILDNQSPSTAVFDEVDSGVGGEVAHHIGERLRALAERCQVIVVTHLHQVASAAAHHLRIQKSVQNGRTITKVRSIHGEDRLRELARMLGGAGPIALEHAKELMRRAAG